MAKYNAFISYSHALDKPLANHLQRVIQTLGKPWYKRRVARVFRDDTSLTATPELWPEIVAALEASEHLILLASPEAARSPWVDKEVAWWLANKGPHTLLIALTDGQLAWRDTEKRFAPGPEMPLPPAVVGHHTTEPFWIDLRPWRGTKTQASKDAQFRSLASKFAARIRGVPPEDLWSEELRQQQRNFQIAAATIVALVGLTIFAGFSLLRALTKEREANLSNAKAQMQLALVKSERRESRAAIDAALASYDAVVEAGAPTEQLEPQLYEVSSGAARGLVAAAQISWPKNPQDAQVARLRFSANKPVVCATSIDYATGNDQEYDACFAFKKGVLTWQAGLKPDKPYQSTDVVQLDVKLKDGSLELYDTQPNGGALVYTASQQPFRAIRDVNNVDAWRCPKQEFVIVALSSEDGAGAFSQSYYSIKKADGSIYQIVEGIASGTLVCSPHAPLLASAENYGNVRIFDMESRFMLTELFGSLARGAADTLGISFSPAGLTMIPSMLKQDGTWTNPILHPLHGDWNGRRLDLPLWEGGAGNVVAMSPDAKYAAILFNGNILTIWDVAGLGITPLATSEDDAGASDTTSENAPDQNALKAAAEKLKTAVDNPQTVSCIVYPGNGNRLIAYGKNRLLVYDFNDNKVVSDEKVNFLTLPKDECPGDVVSGWGNEQVTRIKGTNLGTLCREISISAQECHIFSNDKLPQWLSTSGLTASCAIAYRDDNFWLCGIGSPHEERAEVKMALIDWENQKVVVTDHDYFAHIYAHQHGLADFTVKRSKTCPRMLVRYENWQRGGGAQQAVGAVILDTQTGDVIARVADETHPLFCNVEELAIHMRAQAKSNRPTPVTVESFTQRPR